METWSNIRCCAKYLQERINFKLSLYIETICVKIQLSANQKTEPLICHVYFIVQHVKLSTITW